jgi:hypothetical protein
MINARVGLQRIQKFMEADEMVPNETNDAATSGASANGHHASHNNGENPCLQMCSGAHARKHTYEHTHSHPHTITQAHVHAHAHALAYSHADTHTYTHAHVHVRTYKSTQTNTHTQTQATQAPCLMHHVPLPSKLPTAMRTISQVGAPSILL